MSYEEIDKTIIGSDVFTNGAEGRYAKPKEIGEKKKRAPKATTDETTEQSEEVVKTKKKSRKTHENGATNNEDDYGQIVSSADGEIAVKPKKKRAPKIESNNENLDPVPDGEETPVRKKKSKKSKTTPIEDDPSMLEATSMDDFEPTTIKVKKSKKSKASKTLADTFIDEQTNDFNEYSTNPDFTGDVSYDALPPYPMEAEQNAAAPVSSAYETAILEAYRDLSTKMNFSDFVGNDQWTVIHLPKSARIEPKSRIRKILPGGGGSSNHSDKKSGTKATDQKNGFFKRIRSGVSTLVSDENNLLFGESSQYDLSYYDDDEDGVDTDDLHRYAQKLRELEDADREVNPEYLVLRDGKTDYVVHERDAEGKITLSKRKPIYDRSHDQAPDDEISGKKKFLSRLRINPFARNKDKDGKGSDSPKSTTGTPDQRSKRSTKKSGNKATDDDIATALNNEPLVD